MSTTESHALCRARRKRHRLSRIIRIIRRRQRADWFVIYLTFAAKSFRPLLRYPTDFGAGQGQGLPGNSAKGRPDVTLDYLG